MLKEATYRQKFQILEKWFPLIISEIKKDLKNQHLKNNLAFFKKYFSGKTISKVSTEDLAVAYAEALAEQEGDELAEFLASRWLLQNSDVYYHFEERLKQISEDFDELEQLSREQSVPLIAEAAAEFGSIKTYIFSTLNSVVYPPEVFEKLAASAAEERQQKETAKQEEEKTYSFEVLKKNHERDLARISNRYEKKILGLQKKYQIDVDGLKKQIASLQKKING